MLASLVVGFLAIAPNITLTSSGTTVEQLLREATKQAGVSMLATPNTKGEIVIVSMRDTAPEEFRRRLAQAVGATWEKEGTGFRLNRPFAMLKEQQAAERRIRVQEVQHGMEALRKRVASQPVFDKTAAQALAAKVGALFARHKGHMSDGQGLREAIAIEPESPAGRLAIAALGTLTLEQIADVGPAGRIVYSTKPTAMQRRLAGKIVPALQRYLAEQKLYADALSKLSGTEAWATSWSPLLSRQEPRMPDQLLVSTQRSLYNPALTVRVKLVDNGGKYISQSQTLLDFKEAEPRREPLAKGSIPLSENSQRFMKAVGMLQSGKTMIDDLDLIELLENPEKNDPLSLLTADGLLALAKDRQLIAVVPDAGFIEPAFESMSKDGSLDLAKFSTWLTGQCNVDLADGWLVASPRRMVTTRETRVDRPVLGQFLRLARRSGGPSLEAVADFAVKMPLMYGETIVPMLAFFVMPSLNATLDDRSYEMLRVYGRLNAQQRLAVGNGGMAIAQFAPESRADLTYLAFRADSPLSISYITPPPGIEHRFGLDSEITVVLANGLPPSGTLSMDGQEHEAVLLDGGISQNSPFRPLSAWSLAYTIVAGEYADPSDPRQRVVLDKFRFGRSRQVSMQLDLARNVSARADIQVGQFPPNTASVRYDGLPASFREAVERAKVEVRKSHFAGKTKTPPPY